MLAEAVLRCAVQGALYFWSYTYYLSKYYEFLDTVLLALKVCIPLTFSSAALTQRICLLATPLHLGAWSDRAGKTTVFLARLPSRRRGCDELPMA